MNQALQSSLKLCFESRRGSKVRKLKNAMKGQDKETFEERKMKLKGVGRKRRRVKGRRSSLW
jgi:hypothetical protein